MDLNYYGGLWVSCPDTRPDGGHGWRQSTHQFTPNGYHTHTSPPHPHSEARQPRTLATNTLPPLNTILSTDPPSSPFPSSLIFPNLSRLRRHRLHNREGQPGANLSSYNHHLAGLPLHLPSPERSSSHDHTPVSRPASRISWNSEEGSASTFRPWPSQFQEGIIDLTADSSPLAMPSETRKRAASGSRVSEQAAVSSSKRPKVEGRQVNGDLKNVADLDIRDVEDDKTLAMVLEEQRKASVKAQQEQADKPASFSNVQCIICMEPMTNITVTHCGKPSDQLNLGLVRT